MRKCFLIFITLLAFKLPKAQTDAAKDNALILAARKASNAAIRNHDVDGIASCLSPDVILITGNAKQFVGKETVISRWKEFFAQNPKVFYIRMPQQVTISKNDTLACETGTWLATNSYSGGGSYTAMWCKRNGVWMTRAELFVSLEK